MIPILLPEFIFRFCIWLLLGYRRLRYGYAFRRIPLTQGKFAIVDPADYEKLARYKWFAVGYERSFYAMRMVKAKAGRVKPPIRKLRGKPPMRKLWGKPPMRKLWGKQKSVRMHRAVLDVPAGKFIDHINHNGLDNRKANLRIVTRRENSWNKRKQRGNYSSQYKGVTWLKRTGKWQARIVCRGTSIFIGQFDDEEAAARAYDARAAELFGEYAALNFRRSMKS